MDGRILLKLISRNIVETTLNWSINIKLTDLFEHKSLSSGFIKAGKFVRSDY